MTALPVAAMPSVLCVPDVFEDVWPPVRPAVLPAFLGRLAEDMVGSFRRHKQDELAG